MGNDKKGTGQTLLGDSFLLSTKDLNCWKVLANFTDNDLDLSDNNDKLFFSIKIYDCEICNLPNQMVTTQNSVSEVFLLFFINIIQSFNMLMKLT